MELKLGNSPDTLRMVALLLIVPYGIETWKQPRYAKDGSPTFNRTLWN